MTRIVYQTGQHYPSGIPFDQIDHCDVVFAWFDPDDYAQTLVEIGYAIGVRKRLWLAANKPLDRLMFLIDLANWVGYSDSWLASPAALLRAALDWDARRTP